MSLNINKKIKKFKKTVDKFMKKCGEASLNEYILGG